MEECCDYCQADDVTTEEVYGKNLCEDCQDLEMAGELEDFIWEDEDDVDYDNKPYFHWYDDEDDDEDYGDWEDDDDDDDDDLDGDDSRH
jgi:hypothetical protein